MSEYLTPAPVLHLAERLYPIEQETPAEHIRNAVQLLRALPIGWSDLRAIEDRLNKAIAGLEAFEHDGDTWDDSSPEGAALRLKISRARDAIRIAAGKRPKFT